MGLFFFQWQNQIRNADWQKLASFPWIWTPKECPWQKILAEIFDARQLQPEKVAYADDEETLASLIVAGSGMGLMLEERALKAQDAGEVAIWGDKVFSLPLSFVYQKKRENDPIVQTVLSTIKQVWSASL